MSLTSLSRVCGRIVDVVRRRIFDGEILIENGKIREITETFEDSEFPDYIMPGFVDAHVHIESSMLVPAQFGCACLPHGTIATVSDPHEIANVLGIEGVRFMIDNSRFTPLKIYFGASPCVPATEFETAGGTLTSKDVESLFVNEELLFLSEVMNVNGVLQQDHDLMEKMVLAKRYGRRLDGHAPGLRGGAAKAYFASGITTDHECFELDEALEKIGYGAHIQIRQGSAAKNFEKLHPLLNLFPEKVMFCSDDKHPDDLVKSHINALVARSVGELGYDLMDVLTAACINPIKHYRLPVGMLRVGDPADFIQVTDLVNFNVRKTFIDGQIVAKDGKCIINRENHYPRISTAVNRFVTKKRKPSDFAKKSFGSSKIKVIVAKDGQLVTEQERVQATLDRENNIISNIEEDVLKICVVNRYENDAPPAIGFVKNFGLKRGALASSVAHDSHNIIAVGVDDESICTAVNQVIGSKGGLAVVPSENQVLGLPLPVAGLMSDQSASSVAKQYANLDAEAKRLGSTLSAPFMTLSFMGLLVIPKLKISDKGLFDGTNFSFTELICKE